MPRRRRRADEEAVKLHPLIGQPVERRRLHIRRTVAADERPSMTASLLGTFAVVAVAGLSVAAIVFSDQQDGQKGAKVMDDTAKSHFDVQGYDVIKRKSYKAFNNKEMTAGETATYALKKQETGEAATGTLTCGKALMPGMVSPRLCNVSSIVPK